jgi:hypothetical protein
MRGKRGTYLPECTSFAAESSVDFPSLEPSKSGLLGDFLQSKRAFKVIGTVRSPTPRAYRVAYTSDERATQSPQKSHSGTRRR